MLTPAMEDYLEQIYLITKHKGYVRTIEIAERLQVQSSSVTQMVRKLNRAGLVRYDKHRYIFLTSKGFDLAKDLAEIHRILRDFYHTLGVGDKESEEETMQIRHYISKTTALRLSQMLLHLKEQDENESGGNH